MIREEVVSQICAEVYELLNVLGQDYIDALPTDVYKNISEKRDLNYINKFDLNSGISEEIFSKEAINILLGFDLKYWSSYSEKKEKVVMYKENEKNYQVEIREKYNPDKIFENKRVIEKPTIPNTEVSSTELVTYEKSFWDKIKDIFKEILNKK